MKSLVVLQPSYFPWLGYFEQIFKSDVFVFYDDVQYTKNDWRNRNRIKQSNANPGWLTVPVLFKGKFGVKINEIEINNTKNWSKKHLNTLKVNYAKAPFFKEYISLFENFYSDRWEKLVDLNVKSIELICNILDCERKMVLSSELGISGERSERLLRLCQHLEADSYYSGNASKDYLDVPLFEEKGIKVTFQDYQHPTYSQLHGEFTPYLSAIDLIFNCGPKSLDIITNKNIE